MCIFVTYNNATPKYPISSFLLVGSHTSNCHYHLTIVRPIIPFSPWTTAVRKSIPSIYFTLNVLYYLVLLLVPCTYLLFYYGKCNQHQKKIISGNGSNKYNLVYPTNRKLKLSIFSCFTWVTTICGFAMLNVSPSFTRHRIFSAEQLERNGGAKFPILETQI